MKQKDIKIMAYEAKLSKIMNKGSEDAKYIVQLKLMGKFVIYLDEKLAPTNFEEEIIKKNMKKNE